MWKFPQKTSRYILDLVDRDNGGFLIVGFFSTIKTEKSAIGYITVLESTSNHPISLCFLLLGMWWKKSFFRHLFTSVNCIFGVRQIEAITRSFPYSFFSLSIHCTVHDSWVVSYMQGNISRNISWVGNISTVENIVSLREVPKSWWS